MNNESENNNRIQDKTDHPFIEGHKTKKFSPLYRQVSNWSLILLFFKHYDKLVFNCKRKKLCTNYVAQQFAQLNLFAMFWPNSPKFEIAF